MAPVPTPRPGRTETGGEDRDSDVRVGTTVPDEQLRQMLGQFGDADDEEGGGESRPEEVALNKTRTWG